MLQTLAAVAAASMPGTSAAQTAAGAANELEPFGAALLPAGIRSRFVRNVNGLRVHVLEGGFAQTNRPPVLLLHGFPELAYSWRHVMVPLVEAGYHVVAPDLRGYGRTTGWDADYDADLVSFSPVNYVRDIVGVAAALGYRNVLGLVGHDFGSVVAGWCAVVRPDVFRSVVLMSAPFTGAPAIPLDTADAPPPPNRLDEELAALRPPRKQYRRYYSTRTANQDMWHPPQGLHAFMRAYYHMKSADWKQNAPFPLKGDTAPELAKLPEYYIMRLDKTMPETVAPEMPSADAIARCTWLPDDEMRVYSGEYARTGFQGGLQGYRVRLSGRHNALLEAFSGRTIDQPSMFVAGKSDWGVYQTPGALERMQRSVCTAMEGVHLVDGAGHWVQQERASAVGRLLLDFFSRRRNRAAG
ncbi:MAG TPA: alpha/beta hydrolase [Vicinamibacterales bacterium]|jgi:pimeloyl-ACP methyl ester carboxylesterase